MPQQVENDANIDVHVRTTGPEILADFKDTPIDVLITGVGTGGHITGVAQFLKEHWPNLKVFEELRDAGDVEIGRHTSELQLLMRISYAVFCLNKKTTSVTTRQLPRSTHSTTDNHTPLPRNNRR